VADALAAQRTLADRTLDQTRRDAEAAHVRTLRAIDLEYKAATGRAAPKHAEQREGAAKTRDEVFAAFIAHTNHLDTKAVEVHEEQTWLAETLFESTSKKARQDFEVVRGSLEAKARELTAMQSRAQTMLKAARPAMDVAVAPEAAPTGDPLAVLNAAGERSLALMVLLEHRVHPFVLGPGFVIAELVLGAVSGGVAAVFAGSALAGLIGEDIVKRTAIAAGAGVAFSAIVLLLIRFALKARVPAVASQLAAALSQAQNAGKAAMARAVARRDETLALAAAKRAAEIGRAANEAKAVALTVTRRRQVDEPAVRAEHRSLIEQLERRIADEIDHIETSRAKRRIAADSEHKEANARAQAAHTAALEAAKLEVQRERTLIFDDWRTGIRRAGETRGLLMQQAMQTCPAWNDDSWTRYSPRETVPAAVQIGTYTALPGDLPGGLPTDPQLAQFTNAAFPGGTATLPLLLDLHDRGSLLIQHNAESRVLAIATLNNTMLRLLTAFPPAKVRFTILDPVGLGQSFAGFMHLADLDEQLINDRVWTEPKHIEQKLSELTEHMETVIQKYLRNEFATIQEYNAQAGEVAEPYRFLVFADFPANLSEQGAKRLASIVSSGPKCGVFTLIAHDVRAKSPPWLPLAEMQKAALWLRWENDRFVRQDDEFRRWPIVLEAPPEESVTTGLLKTVGSMSKDLGKVRVPFDMVAPKDAAELWSLDSSEEIRIPLGRAGATKLQYMTLGQGTAQHALIAGRTGSGKSTLLHVIITNLALWYSPDQVEMYLVDFKKGVEFKAYATHELPHARVIAVESEREFGLSVLRKLDSELTRRGQLYRDMGVQDLAGYRKVARVQGVERRADHERKRRDSHTKGFNGDGSLIHSAAAPALSALLPPFPAALPSMPRILFIVDEFQEFFVEDDKLAQEASLLLDRLVRQGRAFGMHVVLGSQTLGGAYSLARSTLGQMAVRIALQCSEADSYLIMSEDNNAPRLLNRPGEAIYNDASGMLEGNSPFQIVWLPEETRERKLADVRRRLAMELDKAEGDDGLGRATLLAPKGTIVFEGNLPADIRRNHLLAKLLDPHATPPPSNAPHIAPQAWMGEAISIKDPTSMVFRRQSASNLLIIGQQEDAAMTMLAVAAASLAAHRSLAPSLVFFDSTPADMPEHGQLEGIAHALTRSVESLVPRFASTRTAAAAITTIADELARRESEAKADAPPIFLVIMGLHRFRDLRKSDDFAFGADDAGPKPDKLLAKILRDGPAMGIHTVAWCDTAANLDRTLERQTAREFEARVLFQMSANDSTALIDTPAAANLGRNRALLYREELGTVEKFRPYAPPGRGWIEHIH